MSVRKYGQVPAPVKLDRPSFTGAGDPTEGGRGRGVVEGWLHRQPRIGVNVGIRVGDPDLGRDGVSLRPPTLLFSRPNRGLF